MFYHRTKRKLTQTPTTHCGHALSGTVRPQFPSLTVCRARLMRIMDDSARDPCQVWCQGPEAVGHLILDQMMSQISLLPSSIGCLECFVTVMQLKLT